MLAIRLPLLLLCTVALGATAGAQATASAGSGSGSGAPPGAAAGAGAGAAHTAQKGSEDAQVPGSFVDEPVVTGIDQAEGIVFAPDGRMFVWQRAGLLWLVKNGALVSPPVIDIHDEVASWGDHGLNGVALDPDFALNGRIYLAYVVDHYYLTHFGLPGYDPTLSDDQVETIGRITRYTVQGDPPVADPASRLVLLGEDIHHGVPICSASHGMCALQFGSDGTLLAAFGDGHGGPPASGTALSDGIITPKENVDSFRAQLVDSLSGKIVRLDPQTGDGVPSNPFFDAGAPRAPRSRVWALGLRNPFRFSVRPGTGSSSAASGDPGSLYIGDVGGAQQEEISVVTGGGADLGWPIWEGVSLQPDIGTVLTPDLDAPNPLYGVTLPYGGTCTQQYFDFQDLLLPDSLYPATGKNPCHPALAITNAPVFKHHPPAIAWLHHDIGTFTPVYDAAGNGTYVAIGTPGAPVQGDQFSGFCSMGGAFNTGSNFPADFAGDYFHADFGLGWIRAFRFDGADKPVSVSGFAESAGPVVAVAMGPQDGRLYYINYGNSGSSDVRRIGYVVGNKKPHAVIKTEPAWGPAPLTVFLDASGSSDPEHDALQYSWDFGDGTPPSTALQPVHVYPSADITAAGTIVAKVFELAPPVPDGKGSKNAEVIRDGDFPPLDCDDPSRQFDTCHWNGVASDKGLFDWIGYTYTTPHAFDGLIFQEGMRFSGFGGWWLAFVPQVRQNGKWENVQPVLQQPEYPGLGDPNYETFEMHFLPMVGDGIRLFGVPGGLLQYFSVGELRVLEQPAVTLGAPAVYPVTLTVTDAAGNTDSTTIMVGVNDSPPLAAITKPKDFGTYSTAAPELLELHARAQDAESPLGDLYFSWQVIEHDNDVTHPGPEIDGRDVTTVLGTQGGDGHIRYDEIVLTVYDPAGFSGTASSYLLPDIDLNLDGLPDSQDIASGHSQDADHDGIPDEAQTDCNGNGVPDLYDIFFGASHDANHNGLPDECEPMYPFTHH